MIPPLVAKSLAVIGCAAVLLSASCERKPGLPESAPTPTAPSATVKDDPTSLAATHWSELISKDPRVVVQGWRHLATADGPVLRRAVYQVDAPPNDQLRIGTLEFQLDTTAMKAWDQAYADAFPPGTEEAAASACIALDELGAGVMASGPTFAEGVGGGRAYPYEWAVLARMYALSKLTKLDPSGSAHDPKGKLAKVLAIGKSGQVAKEVP